MSALPEAPSIALADRTWKRAGIAFLVFMGGGILSGGDATSLAGLLGMAGFFAAMLLAPLALWRTIKWAWLQTRWQAEVAAHVNQAATGGNP